MGLGHQNTKLSKFKDTGSESSQDAVRSGRVVLSSSSKQESPAGGVMDVLKVKSKAIRPMILAGPSNNRIWISFH